MKKNLFYKKWSSNKTLFLKTNSRLNPTLLL